MDKKIFILFVIFLAFISIGAVCANDSAEDMNVVSAMDNVNVRCSTDFLNFNH